ncbi:MAG: recombinase family protein [Candidatus Pacearchaeota archaeon]
MKCIKCGYHEKRYILKFNQPLCNICSTFSPENKKDFEKYINEKIDWKMLDTFRIYNSTPGKKQLSGMQAKAKQGYPVTRAPFGYTIHNNALTLNEDSTKVILIFKTFLNSNISLNKLSKDFGISLNGLKKILKNRTYLGEIKFNNQLYPSNHTPLVNPEIFYATQRKLNKILKPRNNKNFVERYP